MLPPSTIVASLTHWALVFSLSFCVNKTPPQNSPPQPSVKQFPTHLQSPQTHPLLLQPSFLSITANHSFPTRRHHESETCHPIFDKSLGTYNVNSISLLTLESLVSSKENDGDEDEEEEDKEVSARELEGSFPASTGGAAGRECEIN